MFWYYDPTYWMVLIGALIALYAQFRVSAAYSKWSKVPSSTHMTGAQDCQTDSGRQRLSGCPH